MFGIVHDVRWQRIEWKEVSHPFFLFAIHHLSLANDIGVDDLVARQEVVLNLLVSIVEFHLEFASLYDYYANPSFSSLATPKISFLFIGRS